MALSGFIEKSSWPPTDTNRACPKCGKVAIKEEIDQKNFFCKRCNFLLSVKSNGVLVVRKK